MDSTWLFKRQPNEMGNRNSSNSWNFNSVNNSDPEINILLIGI